MPAVVNTESGFSGAVWLVVAWTLAAALLVAILAVGAVIFVCYSLPMRWLEARERSRVQSRPVLR